MWFVGLVSLVLFAQSSFAFKESDRLAAEERIQQHLSAQRLYNPLTSAAMCGSYPCCNITSSESCPINKMPQDQTTLVLPGGQTRCIFSTSTPFAFQVVPGASDKLLFYFQGGGACWDKYSTDAKLCTTDAVPQQLIGAFDRTNEKNAFKDFTIVHVLYCSGDVHGGNVTRPYSDSNGQPVVQAGLANAHSALDWVKQQVAMGALASTFSEVVVMGCSAGSLGAQLWSNEVLTSLKWNAAAVVPDSYAGVFPVGTVGPLMYGYGFCSSGFLSAALYQKCMQQMLSLEEMNVDFMKKTPNVPFAYLQSKVDAVQQSFYVSVAISMNTTSKSITPAQFYADVNEIFGIYNKEAPNFVTYLVDGDKHCFTPYDLYFTADTISATDDGASTKAPLMHVWSDLPLAEGASVDTQCDGNLQGTPTDTTYCSTKVVPKTFTEHWIH